MNRAITQFVAQITDLARRSAVDTLAAVMSNGRRRGRGGFAVALPRGRGAKRSQEELESLGETFVAFVKANPGLRIEQINKQLGTGTGDLALPIRKLLQDGEIHTKGQRRATTYFVGDGAGKKRSKKK